MMCIGKAYGAGTSVAETPLSHSHRAVALSLTLGAESASATVRRESSEASAACTTCVRSDTADANMGGLVKFMAAAWLPYWLLVSYSRHVMLNPACEMLKQTSPRSTLVMNWVRVGRCDEGTALERGTTPTRSRRTCSPPSITLEGYWPCSPSVNHVGGILGV
jgi:hypothetical protein